MEIFIWSGVKTDVVLVDLDPSDKQQMERMILGGFAKKRGAGGHVNSGGGSRRACELRTAWASIPGKSRLEFHMKLNSNEIWGKLAHPNPGHKWLGLQPGDPSGSAPSALQAGTTSAAASRFHETEHLFGQGFQVRLETVHQLLGRELHKPWARCCLASVACSLLYCCQ